MEYLVLDNDELWSSLDVELFAHAQREIVQPGLVEPREPRDGPVVRTTGAHPTHDPAWNEHLTRKSAYLESVHSNWQLVGWNGLHKYNNQDPSMVTAFCAARNIQGAQHDIWAINNDPEYHEGDSSKVET